MNAGLRPPALGAALSSSMDALAATPLLLVACDFDGTLAPIVSDPAVAEPLPLAIEALSRLAAMPQTHVAIISGRALADLRTRVAALAGARLVGSHGAECDGQDASPLSAEQGALLRRVLEWMNAQTGPGLLVERKPASVALHYRNAARDVAHAVCEAIRNGPARWDGVHTRCGKEVVELSVMSIGKGDALRHARYALAAASVVFLGDDSTDEDAFAALETGDVGVKVGDGDTAARFRVADPEAVAALLQQLADRRGAWCAQSVATPIEQHSILSDQRTLAVIDPRGCVVWCCLPRIDSSAVFASLLGGPAAGYFSIEPAVGASGPAPRQHYLGDSFVLRTAWPTLTLTDYLDCGAGRAFQRAGRTELLRVIEGAGRVRIEFAPRLDFGRIETRLTQRGGGLIVEGAIDTLVLHAPGVDWRIETVGSHHTAVAEIDLPGRPVALELRYGTASLEPARHSEPERRARSERFWTGWSATLQLPRVATDAVRRSALVLKALVYGPSGAIAAAGTTSLPEQAGGVRNWDYRYCWPRDAALAATALLRLGALGPGLKLLDWVLGILDRCEAGALLCPLYTVTGGHSTPEAELAHLAGYRGSRPVRVGNAASHQVQLDVFGPIAELLSRLADSGAALSSEHDRLMASMVSTVARRWTEPDHGIWEARRSRRHHVHSKIMCWQTVDRGVRVAEYLGRVRPEWLALRDEIARDVLTHGWNAERGAFCATYGGAEADAAVLWVGLSGLLSPSDARFRSTVDLVSRELRRGPTVHRYFYDDGLPGQEGGFNLCTAWLIEALALVGDRDQAGELFHQYLAQCGPTGLMAEEFDAREGCALGNFPQAYSHLGLINAALALDGAR